MEPPRKKARVGEIKKWNPFEWAFLLGTKSPNSSICRAFGTPMTNPLSELQVLPLIFGFQSWPKELRTFRPPRGYDEDSDGKKLPQVQEDGRVLIMFQQKIEEDWDSHKDDYEPYTITEVFYDPSTNWYELSIGDFKFESRTETYQGDGTTEEFLSLEEVLKKISPI